MEHWMLQHAVVAWVGIPMIALLQELLPMFSVTCERGYPAVSLVFVALVELHHLLAEHKAWEAAKSIPTQPELAVLRTYGVLKNRRRRVIAGFLEAGVLYVACIFPVLARKCDEYLTDRYLQEVIDAPFVGSFLHSVLSNIRFFGLALTFTLINIIFSGVLGIVSMYYYNCARQSEVGGSAGGSDDDEQRSRISGTTCIRWSYSAHTAMMPSVGTFFEEMAGQKRFVLGDLKDVDARGAMQARIDRVMGKLTAAEAERKELQSEEEVEKMRRAQTMHLLRMLFVKVLIGNVLQLWLISTYFSLTFDIVESEMRIKLIVAMVICLLQAFTLMRVPLKQGPLGWLLFAVTLLVIAHSAIKVFFAFKCESHQWNVGMGCLTLADENTTSTSS
eukprot:CAMPEP_0178409224 /NCGR_PEP_ID=MMETSP0689_2-20121128/20353_1 /TAXON_ID=160604 /ORGANISM="Amphidinium massartii, Strain CS-259" /LENGTH=388 /DNA_ID=CAMNT_0020030361 /DNA_START=150 /DNA_END=1316 /DNA_ORIENTATION=+